MKIRMFVVCSLLALCAPLSNAVPVSLKGKTPDQVYTICLEAIRKGDADTIIACHATTAKEMPSKEEMKAGLALTKQMAPSMVTVTKREISGNEATLIYKGITLNPFTNKRESGIGTVKFTKEDGVWKIAEENWEVKASKSSTNAMPPDMGKMMGEFVNAFSNAFAEAGKSAQGDEEGSPVTSPRTKITGATPASSSRKELRIKAFIDGSDVVKVRNNELWYEHRADALPGKWANNNNPTYVNGKAWTPEWEGQTSRPYENVQPFFVPQLGAKVIITHTYGRGKASIVEQPSEQNNQTLSIQLDDPDGGAEWMEVVVRW